ncbi:MAG: hypothetical protein JEY79_01075 [Pseudodesulfovibrio sp.]|nr:hypothetical protein [Pseudodesulfovibrio sp.]
MKEEKDRGGRPTEYDSKYADMVRELVAENNTSQAKLAKVFGVGKATITDWKKAHPDFAQALQEGEDRYKVKVVEKNLFRLCKGIRYTTTSYNPKGLTTRKNYMPPNAKAIELFLSRRAPERWPSVRQIDLNGNMNFSNRGSDLAAFLDEIDGTTQGLEHNAQIEEPDVEA